MALLGSESKDSEVMTWFTSKRNQLDTSSMGVVIASGMFTRRIRVFLGSCFLLRKAAVKVRVVCVERRRKDRWREPGLLAKPTHCPTGPQGARVPLGRQAQRWSVFHLGFDNTCYCFMPYSRDLHNWGTLRRTRFLSMRWEVWCLVSNLWEGDPKPCELIYPPFTEPTF